MRHGVRLGKPDSRAGWSNVPGSALASCQAAPARPVSPSAPAQHLTRERLQDLDVWGPHPTRSERESGVSTGEKFASGCSCKILKLEHKYPEIKQKYAPPMQEQMRQAR